MKKALIFSIVLGTVGAVLWSVIHEEPVDLGMTIEVLEGAEQNGISIETQEKINSCHSHPFDAEIFGNALALLEADLNSTSTISVQQKIRAKRETFVVEMGAKLKREYDAWLYSTNSSETRIWKQKISQYLAKAPNQTSLVLLKRQCNDILWITDESTESEALQIRRALLASKYDHNEIDQFMTKVRSISELHDNKAAVTAFKSESERLFEEFKNFHDKWSRAFGRYVSNDGKNPMDWVRTPSRYLSEAQIRRYAWYKKTWLDEFGEINLR